MKQFLILLIAYGLIGVVGHYGPWLKKADWSWMYKPIFSQGSDHALPVMAIRGQTKSKASPKTVQRVVQTVQDEKTSRREKWAAMQRIPKTSSGSTEIPRNLSALNPVVKVTPDINDLKQPSGSIPPKS